MFSEKVDGIVKWSSACAVIALQQFRDNLVVVSKGPSAKYVMQPVCAVSEASGPCMFSVSAGQRT